MVSAEKQNKMGTMQEGKLLVSMGVPLMLSMLIAALYNIVDTFFVARIPGMGDTAANALSLAFPVQTFMLSLNVGTGVGVGASLSRTLGNGDRERAGKIAGNAMLLYICYYAVMLLFGLFAAEPFIRLFTDDPEVQRLGTTYLRYVTILSFGNMGEKCFEKLLQATGKTTCSMLGQTVGSLLNVVLDPIFIYGIGFVPALGVAGAAIATVIGQCCAVMITAAFHFRKDKEIPHRLKYLRPEGEILRSIMKVGAPAIVMQSLTSFMTLGMNFILKGVSAAAITAYGIYYKLQNFVFMPAFGLNNACVPIIGYNVGAKQRGRVSRTIRYAVELVLGIMAVGIVLFQTFAAQIVAVFGLSDEVSALCVRALRIVSAGFLFAGINVLLQGICQALGGGTYALAICALRLIVGVLPLAAILARVSGTENFIWIVFPIAETLSFVVAVVLTRRLYRRAALE